MTNSSELTKRELIQQEALTESAKHYRCGLGISMGVGKTLIGLRHMEREFSNSKGKYLVVAPKVSIFESWKDDAKKFGLEYLLEHIDFTTYLSLSKKSRDYDVVYLDECHSLLYTHDYYLSTYGGKVLGLSGTPPRYKNSEKGEMVQKYCPIVYTYITDDAVEDKILNDYKIIVHRIPLSTAKTHKVSTKKGGFFMTSESQNYDYWCGRIDSALNGTQQKIFRIMRMQALMQFASKEKYARQLLNMMDDKCIVFCNTTEQADRISVHSYHSKNSMSEKALEAFKNGEIEELTCVQQLNEGVNIPNLKYGIILHSYSNERKSSQRIGRLLRLSPDQKAIIHVLVYAGTIDEDWVQDALRDLDSEKIVYTDPFC
jgi:superfamily II DNA or RNA helicase